MIKKLILTVVLMLHVEANQSIVIAGPSAGVSHPVFHMIKTLRSKV